MLLLRRVVSNESHVSHDSILLSNFPIFSALKFSEKTNNPKYNWAILCKFFWTPTLVLSDLEKSPYLCFTEETLTSQPEWKWRLTWSEAVELGVSKIQVISFKAATASDDLLVAAFLAPKSCTLARCGGLNPPCFRKSYLGLVTKVELMNWSSH